MAKLLLICDVFPPGFAPRMGYLVKYLRVLGWSTDVVTLENLGNREFQSLLGSERVLRIKEQKLPKSNLLEKSFRFLRFKQNYRANADRIVRLVFNNFEGSEYDIILSSTAHRIFILEAARIVASQWNKPWVADLRDLYEQLPVSGPKATGFKARFLEFFNRNFHDFVMSRRNICFRSATAITSVSPWHIEQLKPYNENLVLIYNGYDPEQFYPAKQQHQNTFNVVYTGSVYEMEHQDPSFLFLAAKDLFRKGVIDPEKFRIQFYTKENSRRPILDNPAYSEISQFVDFYDYVDTKEIPKLLNDSSVLLLLSNVMRSEGPKGLISTTKYFEYLAVEKPILCVRSDENLLEESINKSMAGLATRSLEDTYDFILKYWKNWQRDGYTSVKVNRDYIRQFSRKKQALQFVQLFDEISKE